MTGGGPRLKTQRLSLRSTATPEHSPKFQPFGSCAEFFTTWWGREGPDLSSPEAGASVSDTASSSNSDFIARSVYMNAKSVTISSLHENRLDCTVLFSSSCFRAGKDHAD